MKFKVGDRVKIVISGFRGRIAVITKIEQYSYNDRFNHQLEVEGYEERLWFAKDELELAKEKVVFT